MFLNLIVVGFVIGMGVLWATYGLFSALIHLVAVIAAGAIAFAVWEPVSVLLLQYIPDYAWGVGLVLPFAVALTIFRVATDKLITGNMQFPGLINQVLGGAVGALMAVLTAGITLIGIAYLPLPLALLGYQPYQIMTNGTVADYEGDNVSTLWIKADRWTVSFFDTLSLRGFSSARPLAQVHPDLFAEASSFRLGRFYDVNASLVAQPDNVEVTSALIYTDPLPEGLDAAVTDWLNGGAATSRGDQIVSVGTAWENPKGNATYDGDNILRVPPYQVQLLATVGDDPALVRHMPVAWSNPSDINVGRDFYQVASNTSIASNLAPPADINWVYAIPANAEAKFLSIRGVRIPLPDPDANDAEALAAALGAPLAEDTDAGDEPQVAVRNPAAAERIGEKIGGGYTSIQPTELDQNAALPRAVSPNDATGLDIEDGVVRGGKDTTTKRGRSAVAAKAIQVAGSLQPIRLRVQPSSLSGNPLSNAVAGGSTEADIWLEAANGKPFYGIGYAHASGDELTISIEAIRRSTDIPLNNYKDGDTLYIYYAIPPNVKLAKFAFGDAVGFELDYTVEDRPSR